MQIHSGINPHGSYLEFLKKDPIKNIDVHRDSIGAAPDLTEHKDKWAIGTTKHIFKQVNAKGKIDRRTIETVSFPRNPTDNISYDPPANDRPF